MVLIGSVLLVVVNLAAMHFAKTTLALWRQTMLSLLFSLNAISTIVVLTVERTPLLGMSLIVDGAMRITMAALAILMFIHPGMRRNLYG